MRASFPKNGGGLNPKLRLFEESWLTKWTFFLQMGYWNPQKSFRRFLNVIVARKDTIKLFAGRFMGIRARRTSEFGVRYIAN